MEAAKIAITNNDSLTFGKLLNHILHLRHLNQVTLAHRANVSQSYISKLIADQRDLTDSMAEKFANILGGKSVAWVAAYQETKSESSRPLAHLVFDILGTSAAPGTEGRDYVGTPVRQLRQLSILSLFDPKNEGEVLRRNVREPCEIENFEPKRVSMTSYDTCAGSEGIGRQPDGDWIGQPLDGEIIIRARSHKFVGTKECITLPSWLEAEIHPASNIALKPLIVSHGPIVDPGWSGRLFVTVYNPTDKDIVIDCNERFLTLRFWLAETEAGLG